MGIAVTSLNAVRTEDWIINTLVSWFVSCAVDEDGDDVDDDGSDGDDDDDKIGSEL